MLLLAEIDLILEKRGCKADVLEVYSNGYIKIVLVLLTEERVLYIGVIIAQISVLGLGNLILGCKVYFAIFLVFNKQF